MSVSKVLDETGVYKPGCQHYVRNCELLAECCGQWVVCRLCHDENEENEHTMERFATKVIRCMLCDTVQKVGRTCSGCGVLFARYYCNVCKLYDDTPGKDIYHCDMCGICRVGKRSENVHCRRCGGCIPREEMSRHRCVKGSLRTCCPICEQDMFSSIQSVVSLRCGHGIHLHCLLKYTREYFTCPVCQKTLQDMREVYEQIDEVVKRDKTITIEKEREIAEVGCYDCGEQSLTEFHRDYLKCRADGCGGYNTTLIRILRDDKEEACETKEDRKWTEAEDEGGGQ